MDIVLIPVIAALIGWATNYIAVKMLFHPRRPVNLLLFKIQGVFPKRQAVLAEKLGKIVAEELFSTNDVIDAVKSTIQSPATIAVVENKVEQVLISRLSTDFPLIAMMLSTDMLETIKNSFRKELGPLLESIVDQLGGSLNQTLNVSQVVENKVATFSSDKLEEILFAIMSKEFRFIEFIGGLIGLIIGIAQVFIQRNIGYIEEFCRTLV